MSTTNKQHIETAIIEAGKFIKAAKAAIDADKKRFGEIGCWGLQPSKFTGAMRRRSMDLSQALVKLRSSDND